MVGPEIYRKYQKHHIFSKILRYFPTMDNKQSLDRMDFGEQVVRICNVPAPINYFDDALL